MIFSIYRSKFNKETLRDLKYKLTLPELMDLREYIDCNDALEAAQHKDSEQANANK